MVVEIEEKIKNTMLRENKRSAGRKKGTTG